ncbi:MAG TPA: glycosyltransferase family 2 protein [Desulfosporosinus sp.]|nr:glycosyltransferase family 2 protein [Desulfosporosinus sp.]
MHQITVLIPTYNRKERLIRTLNALENQTDGRFYVVISDNASNYNIDEVLIGRTKAFNERISIYKRKQNVGADANIVNLFTFCTTKWAWFLADDDFVLPNAITIINTQIESMPNIGAFNFSIVNFSELFINKKEFRSAEELIDFYYPSKSKWHGDLIFLSNKVFNTEILQDCISYMYKYNYTRISTVVLILKMLENKIPYCTINEKIVNYNDKEEISWNICEVVLASRTFTDIEFSFNKYYWKHMLTIVSFNISLVYKVYFNQSSNNYNKIFLDQIYHGLYKYFLPFSSKIIIKAISNIVKSKIGFVIIKNLYNFLRGTKSLLTKKAVLK